MTSALVADGDERAYGDITIYVGNTKLPPNVLTRGYSAYIESKTAVLFSDEQVGVIVVTEQKVNAIIGLIVIPAVVGSIPIRHPSTLP